jgi:hypothetical protein
MNLLGAALYDPAGAVSKVTTSLLAMTALDTTNLRIAFTVPAHGFVKVKMSCVHHGSTTSPQVLLGILEGSTVRARVSPNVNLLQTAIATSQICLSCDFTIGGLSAGAVNWDAAYGVEIVASANGAIKYGGPNNTTTNDAFGAFVFEVWDPRPLTTGLGGGVNVTQLLGTAWLTPGTAGTPDVNVKLWNALTTVELPLVPTTAGRKLDVSAGGEAGVDWANVGSPTTAVDLSGTTIKTTQKVDVDTIKTNPVVNGGTITFPTNATVASTTNITAAAGCAVSSIGANVITTASINDGAFTAAKFAADFLTAAKIAADVGTEIAAAVWDRLTSALTTVGSIGKLLVDNVNTTISSRAAQTTVDAIKLSTDNLPSDPADESLIIAATDAIMSRLGAPAGASVSADMAAVKSDTAAVKTKTDSLTFTAAGQVDSNIQSVNDVAVNGVGVPGNQWGP